MGLGWEPGSHVYIWFYSGMLVATLGATVAKERVGLAAGSYAVDPVPTALWDQSVTSAPNRPPSLQMGASKMERVGGGAPKAHNKHEQCPT
jgi:hypothetical protein